MAEELEFPTDLGVERAVAVRRETRAASRATLRESPFEEAELVRRAREGDGEAFHLLYARHARPVRRFLGGVLRDAAAADDALQETFARVHRKLGALRDAKR